MEERDEQAQVIEEQERRIAQEELESDFQRTFSTPSGERSLAFLYQYCRQNRTTYVQGDSHDTAFFEGKRDVILMIMSKIHVDDAEIINRSRDRALTKE